MAVSQLERASKAWPILALLAKNKKTMTYGELGAAIGVHHRAIRFVLSVLQDYCLEEKLPSLTILIVNSSGKKPGTGFIAIDLKNFEQGLNEVWDFDWLNIENPFSFISEGETANSLIKQLTDDPDESMNVYSRIKSRGIKQTIFRDALIKTYRGKCAFTELSFLSGLEACHIVPWIVSNDDERLDVRNGILLNSFHHKLFDKGIITFTNDCKIVYCDPLGKDSAYSKMDKALTVSLHGKSLHLPFRLHHRPHPKFISKHNELLEWNEI